MHCSIKPERIGVNRTRSSREYAKTARINSIQESFFLRSIFRQDISWPQRRDTDEFLADRIMEATVPNVLKLAIGAFVAASVCAVAGLAYAQGEPPARYTMSPAEGGGVVRLDTRTGAMTLCRPAASEWNCRAISGDNLAERQELDRLRAENQALQAEVRRLEELVLPPERNGTAKPPGDTSKPGLKLPTEEDVDQALSYLERMWRRFQERMKDFEPKEKGTPL